MRTFAYAMLREIYEQPEAVRRTLAMYTEHGRLKEERWKGLTSWTSRSGEVLIAASGSSRHSGLAAEVMLEDLSGLAVDVEYASEYSCRGSEGSRFPSVIVLSQSGETSDTLAALRTASGKGQPTLAITNAPDSTMAREATVSMPLGAGTEVAIPATKSFLCQLVVLYLLSLYESEQRGTLASTEVAARLVELDALPAKLEAHLEAWERGMNSLAATYRDASTFLYLGRGVHYPIAREGALKLKEASYVHAEGYPTGELKHGPNALVSERVPLVVLATVDHSLAASVLRYEKTLQLLEEMKAQGARVLAIANQEDRAVKALATECVCVPPLSEHLLPMAEVVPLQLFSYFMALQRGIDVDRPRNLAKAVIESAAG